MKVSTLFICLCLLTVWATIVSAYHVKGNKILDPNDKEVILHGIDRPSLEWSKVGEHLSLADYTLMKAWGANIIRVSLNQDWWSDTAYKTTVRQQYTWIRGLEMGVIFDLHWNNGGQQNFADANSIPFWSSVASIYKDDPYVMFELYNEPHDIDVATWKSGMQGLYDAVRSAGSTNIVLVCGLDWAYDLGHVSNGYALTGTNIVYASHPYDYSGKQIGDWPRAFGNLAATYPVLLSEFGQYCATGTYVKDLLAFCQERGIHWTAWAWYAQGCGFPSIINDWNGTPFPGVGQTVKAYLAGNYTEPVVIVTPVTTPLVVYTDSLQNGFADWSWATSRSISNTEHVHSGSYAIKFTVQTDEAIYLHTTTSFQLGAYSSFQFYVYATISVSADKLGFLTYGSANTAVSNIQFPTALTAGSWTLISVPISSLGLSASTDVTGIAIQDRTHTVFTTIWIDDISVTIPPPSTTASTSSSTSASTSTSTTTTTTTTTTAKPTTTTTTTSSTTVQPTTTTTTSVAASTTTTTTAKPTTSTTTSASSSSTTSAPSTSAASSSSATTASATTSASATTGTSACSAASVVITQTAGSSWVDGGVTITQYAVTISSSCTSLKITKLSLTAQNWNPKGFWGASASGTVITIPDYAAITSSSSYSGFAYQNAGGIATFTVQSITFGSL